MGKKAKAWLFVLLAHFVSNPVVPCSIRGRLYRTLGLDFHDCRILSGLRIDTRNVFIGERSFVNTGVLLEGWGGIRIGSDVNIAPNVSILTSTHDIGGKRRAGQIHSHPVSIGDGAWLGAGAIVLPGTTVGDGAIVCAGALVRQDVAPNTMVGGVPARVIRKLPDARAREIGSSVGLDSATG